VVEEVLADAAEEEGPIPCVVVGVVPVVCAAALELSDAVWVIPCQYFRMRCLEGHMYIPKSQLHSEQRLRSFGC
jgi:hypothetical protein